MKKTLVLLLILSTIQFVLRAQIDSSAFSQKLEKYRIKVSVAMQLWGTYSTGMEVFDAESRQYFPVDNRFNAQLRRTRLAASGKVYDQLSFNLTAAMDLVGKDLLAATEAGGNNGSSPSFRLWNAYVQWQLIPKKELINLVIGYQVPQIGRESITSALRSTSMEKSWSQNYLRRHLTGTGPGRALGLNAGGLIPIAGRPLLLSYEVGIFNPVFEAFDGNSTGRQASLLVVGRVAAHFGNPEMDTYSLNHKINYFGKRKGLTLGFSIARHGQTDLFKNNRAVGGDFLFNFGPVNVDGEYFFLSRTCYDQGDFQWYTIKSGTGYLRFSYNISLPKKYTLEPVAMYWLFKGPMKSFEQSHAATVNSFSGEDSGLDLGLNFYFNPDLRLSLHYTWRNGNAGKGPLGVAFNNYFYQPGLGAIRRGDWLGLGFTGFF